MTRDFLLLRSHPAIGWAVEKERTCSCVKRTESLIQMSFFCPSNRYECRCKSVLFVLRIDLLSPRTARCIHDHFSHSSSWVDAKYESSEGKMRSSEKRRVCNRNIANCYLAGCVLPANWSMCRGLWLPAFEWKCVRVCTKRSRCVCECACVWKSYLFSHIEII